MIVPLDFNDCDESESSIDEMVERINLDIENNNSSIESKLKQKENIKLDNETLENNIKELLEKINEIDEKVNNSGNQVNELKAQRIEKNNSLSKAEKDYESQFEVIEGLKEQIVKIDVKKSKLEQDIEDVVNKLWEEYELTPNNVGEYQKPENVQSQTRK